MARTLRLVSGREPSMVWHADRELPAGTDLVVIPGGFSYGDYLRCGAIAARSPIMDAVRAGEGGLVLGVCNGFQILCEAGLLPGVLMRNENLRFICHDVYLRVERSNSTSLRAATMPVRLFGSRSRMAKATTLRTAKRSRSWKAKVVCCFAIPRQTASSIQTEIVNGAINAIAGIVSDQVNVLGMMPHPENHD